MLGFFQNIVFLTVKNLLNNVRNQVNGTIYKIIAPESQNNSSSRFATVQIAC